jgi:hypothetical protein
LDILLDRLAVLNGYGFSKPFRHILIENASGEAFLAEGFYSCQKKRKGLGAAYWRILYPK